MSQLESLSNKVNNFLKSDIGQAAMEAGAEKGIEDTKELIYKASRYMPEDEGYKLIEEFERALRFKAHLTEKKMIRDFQSGSDMK